MRGLMSAGISYNLEKMELKESDVKSAAWSGPSENTASISWTAEKDGYVLVLFGLASNPSHGDITDAYVKIDGQSQDLFTPMFNFKICIKKVKKGQTVSVLMKAKTTDAYIDFGCFLYAVP